MIKQRIHDWLHERYIRRLGEKCRLALHVHDRPNARLYWQLMLAAIRRRSPGQVERMESRMDFNVRRSIKVRVMDAFLRGRIHSTIVTAVFRLLRLRSL